jgi:hypothetical protein
MDEVSVLWETEGAKKEAEPPERKVVAAAAPWPMPKMLFPLPKSEEFGTIRL